MAFTTNRSLLNPKFEGYRLSPLSQDYHVITHILPSLPSQLTSRRSSTPLSFEEVQSRISHNHLAANATDGIALYVDGDLNVVEIIIEPESLEPTFKVIYEIPKTINRRSRHHKEYPSIIHLCGNVWLVADGDGLVHALTVQNNTTKVHGVFRQRDNTPFKIHACQKARDKAVCIISARHIGPAVGSASQKATERSPPAFDVWAVTFPIGDYAADVREFETLWHGSGNDVPVYAILDASLNAFLILGRSLYQPEAVPFYQPSQDEIVPFPSSSANGVGDKENQKPPPYSWTQTSDTVTIAFPLPSHVPKSAINVTLTTKAVTLIVDFRSTIIDIPRFTLRPFWDGILSSSSLWTWDKEGDKAFGLLTLHLDKQHEGVRWMHVFAPSASSGKSKSADEEDIPETLDPSELANILEALEKYTSAIREGKDASGLGLGTGVPSLADGEMDEEVDSNIGKSVWTTWVNLDGSVPTWAAPRSPIHLLSTPMPGIEERVSLVGKTDIDGLLYTLDKEAVEPVWEHSATHPALAFVLASKRDTRFTYHVPGKAVFAFESGSSVGSGNMYIYHAPAGREIWTKQSVLKVSGGISGALLGVAVVSSARGGIILCLCEKELLVVKNVLL